MCTILLKLKDPNINLFKFKLLQEKNILKNGDEYVE